MASIFGQAEFVVRTISPILVARRPSSFLFRHTLAFLAGLGKTDRDRLLAALHLATLAATTALSGALLVPAHFAFNISLRAASIFGLLLFLCGHRDPPSNDVRRKPGRQST